MLPVKSFQAFKELLIALQQFLTPSHKKQLFQVSLWACLLSLLEMSLAAAVIPYIQCLGGRCAENLTAIVMPLGWPVVPALSLGLLLLITAKLGVQALLHWSAAHLNQRVQHDTVSRLLAGYLHMDWVSFRSRHQTHYFRRCATTAVDAAYVTQQSVTMISSALMLVFLIGLMLWQHPLISVVLGLGFWGLNMLTQHLIGRRQNQLAHERELALQRWSIGMSEAFSSFREIRVYALEKFFLDHLDRSISRLAHANKRLDFLPRLPHLILDFSIFAILFSAVSVWLLLERPIAELVPHLVFYAVVARAILPAMVSLLSTRAVLFGSIVNIRLVLDEIAWITSRHRPVLGITPVKASQGRFALENVTFRHSPDLDPVILNGRFEVPHPSWVAVVGASGAGKSTLLELLCGVLAPQEGKVVHEWPSDQAPQLAYVPQRVALLDGSLAENVVFGFDDGDNARIDEVLRLACLSDLSSEQGPLREMHAGADGARLSGGERQRLAIARALYRSPDLLLLDEVTSGLDEETETRLFTTLRQERPNMSVVFITHRPGSLRFADQVVRVENAQVRQA